MMKLNTLAEQSGYSVSTIYDYLRTGLLHPPQKDGPTRSVFDQSHLDRLNRIRILKEKQISLAEIRKMISAGDPESGDENETVRQQIVDKALALFSKHHYENTKISDITRALNMGSGTFYRYFKSKEELFLECLERLPEVMVPREVWDEVLSKKDILGRLKMRGYAMFKAFPSYTGMLNYAKLSLGSDNKNLAKKAAECIESLVLPLKKDLEQFISEGSVRKLDEELVAYMLLGINETFFHRMLIDSKYTIEEGFDIIEEFIGHAISTVGEAASGGAPDAREQVRDLVRAFMLVDIQGNRFALDSVQFNDNASLSGKFHEGVLRVAMEDISEVVIEETVEGAETEVTTLSGRQIRLQLNPEDVLSGSVDVGDFRIKISKVSSMTRKAPPV